MKVTFCEEVCPKCNGTGKEDEIKWCVDWCGKDWQSCWRPTGQKIMCQTCCGTGKVNIICVEEI